MNKILLAQFLHLAKFYGMFAVPRDNESSIYKLRREMLSDSFQDEIKTLLKNEGYNVDEMILLLNDLNDCEKTFYSKREKIITEKIYELLINKSDSDIDNN